MARLRSPAYPNASLADVVEFAQKIHERDRQHPVSREVAAQHMGFSGLSESSDRALSALLHFDLAEKAAKGEIRISDLALRIIHSHDLAEHRAALREAAFKPDLFQELRERYPGDPPSLSGLSSYLTRSNFAPRAIGPAARAYLETCYYLQRERAYESDSRDGPARADSGPAPKPEEPVPMNVKSVSVPSAAPPALPPSQSPFDGLPLNAPHLNIRDGLVHVEALLDHDKLAELERYLVALKALLKPKEAVRGRPRPGGRRGRQSWSCGVVERPNRKRPRIAPGPLTFAA